MNILIACEYSRTWAMPNHNTFQIKPISDFVRKYLDNAHISVDPFARNNVWSTHTNDINPSTTAQYHLNAVDFIKELKGRGVKADLVILDMPYSPRQVSECYQDIGRKVTMLDTQSGRLYKEVRDAVMDILADEAIVLSFGWNTVGMGKKRYFEIKEIMLCCHGGAHNDTICMAERRIRKG